jgi:membrane protein
VSDSPGGVRRSHVRRGLHLLWRDHLQGLRGHDLALTAGGVTFYAGIALVPTVLVAVRAAAALTSPERIHALGDLLATILPDPLGAPSAVEALVAAGLSMSWLATLIAAVPATFYGEGLRRAFGTLSRTHDSYTGWRGRARVVPLFGVTPLLLLAMLFVVPTLSRLFGSAEVSRSALAVYVGFLTTWVVVSPPLGYVYRVVGPEPLDWRAVAWGAAAAGSFVAGFLQGFVLFLALPIDLGAPFGGLDAVGAMVAIGLWLWLLHLIVLVGYGLTQRIDDRGGWPWALPGSGATALQIPVVERG